MHKPKPVPGQPNQGKRGESMSKVTRPSAPQGGMPGSADPGPSIMLTTAINAGAGTRGESGKVRKVPPRCC